MRAPQERAWRDSGSCDGAPTEALLGQRITWTWQGVHTIHQLPDQLDRTKRRFGMQVRDPIHQAAWKGDAAEVERLVAEGVQDVNAETGAECEGIDAVSKPLMLAAYKGHEAMVERLLA